MLFDRRKSLPPARRDRQQALPRVGLGALADDQPARLEAAQDAAQVAGIEAEILGEFGRGRPVAMDDLVEHPRFGERERALQPAFLQHADALGVEAVEAPHAGDALARRGLGHGAAPGWLREYC
jgi:hypothetical protein